MRLRRMIRMDTMERRAIDVPQFRPEECARSSKRISSIWNAAGSVSMRTVPRMVPTGMRR
jgi:hypothetical protein